MEESGRVTALVELLEEFSRAQFRAKDVGAKVEKIELRCLELFGKDYCYSIIQNANGELCSHYPRQIVFLEYESAEDDKHMYVSLLKGALHICRSATLAGWGEFVTSSEKVDKAQRYADFTLLSIPYPGCEFFKDYKDRDYAAEGLVFNWKQARLTDYVDAPLSIPLCLTRHLNIDWREYQSWDLVKQTQNYLRLLIHIINGDDNSGLLVHCISGWDRTPLFVSLLRLSLWADGMVHSSLEPAEILYLTIAYDWYLFGHMLVDRLSKGEEIFFFCFNFLKHITSDEFSSSGRKARRKSSQPRDPGLTLEDFCALSRKKTHTSSPQAAVWNRTSEDHLLQPSGTEAKSSSSSSSNHSDIVVRTGSSPLEVPQRRSADHSQPGSSVSTDYGSWQMVSEGGSVHDHGILSAGILLPFSFPDEKPSSGLHTAKTERASRLEAVQSIFLSAYNTTIGLRTVPPSPSGAISGLLEQFARGVGLRGASAIV
ncbi:hypothetical protein GDO78_009441 [Eleutherodactylus coqui]|uniref:Myotubularin related protein 14 n=1 Tax=Eleutherodactylus coqui TaxID=57060 RepID=A0A8J6FB31_ELECQ|nr:hypothetical protein GDO78_009441 [Eleutherodactylus coqui]